MNALPATTIFPSLCIATLSALLSLATVVVTFPESPKLVSRLPSAPYLNTVKQDWPPALNEYPTTTIFPSLLQRHSLTLAGSCAYRSSHFAVAIETRVQAAVRVIAHERKLIDTADVGISCDHNLSIALRRHAVAVGANSQQQWLSG